MQMTYIFGGLAALLMLAFVANRLSRLTRVPDLIVLMVIGILLGPVLHVVDHTRFESAVDVLGTLALILILFQGGLEIELRHAVRYMPGGLLLALLGYGLSLGLIAVAGRFGLHLAREDCLLLGAALGCTSGSVVLPALQQIDSPESIKTTLTIESSVGEIMAVLMVANFIGLAGEQSLLTGLATGFARRILVGSVLAIAAGVAWSKIWPKLAAKPNSNVLNLAVVLGVYAASRYLGGSGLLSTLIFGVTLANVPRTPHMIRQGLRMLAFHAELTFLVRTFFFVILGVVAQFIERRYVLPILGIVVALVLGRYLAVLGSEWAVPNATRKQKELLFWMLPRGLVTAVLALQIVAARGQVFAFLPAMAFTVILVTNLFVVWGAVRAGTSLISPEIEPVGGSAEPAELKAVGASASGNKAANHLA